MLTLNDGRSELWQWDTGRKLTVDADCSQVHFSNKVFGRSIDVDVVDGIADIPDTLLQTDKELTAWAFVGTAENGYTKISKIFKVNRRNKPSDYVFTEQDQTTLGEILERIEDLENRPSADISKEDIQDAVNEYLDNNPVSFNETDPTVPDWAKQPEPPKVEIPGTLPNPNKLTFTGAVQAEYDGSEEVTVEIPDGGSGGNADYELPIATPEKLGGVKPATKGADMTQKVGVDELGGLWTAPGGAGGNGDGSEDEKWELLEEITLEETVKAIETNFFDAPQKKIRIVLDTPAAESDANFMPVTVWTCNNRTVNAISFYPKAMPMKQAMRSFIEVELMNDTDVIIRMSYSSFTEKNGAIMRLMDTVSGDMYARPIDPYGNNILPQFMRVTISTYGEYAAGTRLRVWGVAK